MIHNVTEYTLKKYRELDARENRLNVIITWSLTIIVAGLAIILPFFTTLDKTFFIILGAAILVIVAAFRIIRYFRFGKNISASIRRDYYFNEKGFKVTSSNKGNESTTNYQYSILVDYKYDRNNIYLFITKKSVFIIDNNGYLAGSRSELLELLNGNIQKKKT